MVIASNQFSWFFVTTGKKIVLFTPLKKFENIIIFVSFHFMLNSVLITFYALDEYRCNIKQHFKDEQIEMN